jgi:hypothetical protein
VTGPGGAVAAVVAARVKAAILLLPHPRVLPAVPGAGRPSASEHPRRPVPNHERFRAGDLAHLHPGGDPVGRRRRPGTRREGTSTEPTEAGMPGGQAGGPARPLRILRPRNAGAPRQSPVDGRGPLGLSMHKAFWPTTATVGDAVPHRGRLSSHPLVPVQVRGCASWAAISVHPAKAGRFRTVSELPNDRGNLAPATLRCLGGSHHICDGRNAGKRIRRTRHASPPPEERPIPLSVRHSQH